MKAEYIESSLLQFLTDKGVLEQFIANIEKQNSDPDYFTANDLCSCIAIGFDWNLTPEGFSFWDDLDTEFDFGIEN
jgi:hypothetical protein